MPLTTAVAEPPLEVRPTRFGKGVFARKTFRPKEKILEFRGRIYTRREYLGKVNPEKCHYMQIGDDLFLGPTKSPDNFVNHCCAPNAGLMIENYKAYLLAVDTIEAGTEITFDYSTSMAEDHWEMDCACGAPACRGRVRDFKYLQPTLQKVYVDLGIVPEFVMRSAGLDNPHDLFHVSVSADSMDSTGLRRRKSSSPYHNVAHAHAEHTSSVSNGFRNDDIHVGGNHATSVSNGFRNDDIGSTALTAGHVVANQATSVSNAQPAH